MSELSSNTHQTRTHACINLNQLRRDKPPSKKKNLMEQVNTPNLHTMCHCARQTFKEWTTQLSATQNTGLVASPTNSFVHHIGVGPACKTACPAHLNQAGQNKSQNWPSVTEVCRIRKSVGSLLRHNNCFHKSTTISVTEKFLWLGYNAEMFF